MDNKQYNEHAARLLMSLSGACGVSGREGEVAALLRERLSGLGLRCRIDPLGSLIARKGSGGRKTLMLDAHIDEVGLLVSQVDDRGFLRFISPLGLDRRVLLASRLLVHGRETLPGVVCSVPPHLQKKEDAGKLPEAKDMAIDVGLSADRARELVRPGDAISFAPHSTSLAGTRFCGKSLDNRAGAAALVLCLEALREKELPFDVAALFSVQEEAGVRGAKPGAFEIRPDEALVVDVTFGQGSDGEKDKSFPLGGGPAVGMAPVLSRGIAKRLMKTAERVGIPFAVEVMGGNTGTNAAAVHNARDGVPTGLLSIPLRYMHTARETIDLEDVVACGRLIYEYILEKAEVWSNE